MGLAQPAAAASAGDPSAQDPGVVDVVEVSGLLDPVLVDFVERAVADAERSDARALVLQLDSAGAVVGEDRFEDLVDRVADASVPVGVWVGPSGAAAGDEAARLVEVAAVAGMAPGTTLDVGPGVAPGGGARVDDEEALDLGLVDGPAPTVGDFVVGLEAVESRVVTSGDQPRREPVTEVRFGQLPLVSQLMHTVASPEVAYLLLVVGLALVVFELYTAGIGVAALVGAGSLVLASYGLAVLPTRPVAVALILVALFGYAVDVQTGVPRAWTSIATVALVAGSVMLYDGLRVSWITLVAAFVGMLLAMLAGMPAMVRARFSTPTIGRGWMVGEGGEAVVAVAPEGVVRVRDALWRARTNRATPIGEGAPVRVVAIDGPVLEVEPEEGAARDHR